MLFICLFVSAEQVVCRELVSLEKLRHESKKQNDELKLSIESPNTSRFTCNIVM